VQLNKINVQKGTKIKDQLYIILFFFGKIGDIFLKIQKKRLFLFKW